MPSSDPRTIVFPVGGLHENAGYNLQPPGTSSNLLNVVDHDAILGRGRGGQRGGLSKWFADRIKGNNPIQNILRLVQATDESSVPEEEFYINRSGLSDATIISYGDANVTTGFSFDYTSATSTSINGASRDVAGNVYICGTVSSTWAGSGGTSASVLKINSAGVVQWSFNTGQTCNRILYSESANRVVVAGTRSSTWTGSGGLNRSIWCLNASTGAVVWTYDTLSTTHQVQQDNDGRIFVTGNRSASGVASANAVIWRFSTGGTLLASYDTGYAGGIFIDCYVSDEDEVGIFCQSATTTWVGNNGSSKNIFILNNSLANPSLANTFSKQAGSSGASTLKGVIANDGSVILAGSTVSSVNVRRFDRAGTDVWTKNTGTSATHINYARHSDSVIVGFQTGGGWFRWAVEDGTQLQTQAAVTSVDFSMMVPSASGFDISSRSRETLVVAGGSIKKIVNNVLSTPTGGGNSMRLGPFDIQSAPAYAKAFFVDGENELTYDPVTNAVTVWTATTAGTLPVNPRLICLWRGRIVLSGVRADAHNWFMSAQGDPFDYDYAPATTSATQAVAGNNSEAGLVGDIITALIPYSDDVLIFGGDHSIWQMSGDPAAGGAIDCVSDETGIAWGKAWTRDPEGILYFFGTDGVYKMVPGERPIPLTMGKLDERMKAIDLATSRILMAWDYANKGLWMTVSTADLALTADSYFYSKRADAWFPCEFPASMGPSHLLAYDAEKADDKATLFGSRDGYIREYNVLADDDDSTDIETLVRFAPVSMDLNEGLINGLTVVMAEDSGDVTLKAYTGQSAEQLAQGTSPRFTRVITDGRNNTITQRIRGAWLAIEMTSLGATRWAVESIKMMVKSSGKPKRLR